ncbi:Hsp20/alpha crystallin family protein [Rhizobium lentis]|uniref:Hsp20/alpha crystallin family protein n=1 Tax=Rhizobium lentis TaxID=1138194 RepID=UPI001C830887|nr:Hsp20/alpha crystallin family protein [Rhizobium lentis]MBX5135346.1 Hsp20/alpha crystallin family protein [Rhizobium lentis]
MADATKLAVKNEDKPVQSAGIWSPFEALRSEIDRLFDGFVPSPWRSSDRSIFARGFPSLSGWAAAPAVDVIEKDDAFEITAEMPGLDQKNIEVTLSNSYLTIRGEKQEEKEDKQKEYHVSERRYGSFQRTFQIPDGVDANKVDATFTNGVLKVRLPKSADAKKNERKVEIKVA